MVALIVALVCLTVCVSLSTNIWLSKWIDKAKVKTAEKNASSSSSWIRPIHDMSVYSTLGIVQGSNLCSDDRFSLTLYC